MLVLGVVRGSRGEAWRVGMSSDSPFIDEEADL